MISNAMICWNDKTRPGGGELSIPYLHYYRDQKNTGFSRLVSAPTCGWGQEVFNTICKSHGSSRVGSAGVGNATGRVEWGRVRRFSNITGRPGSPWLDPTGDNG